MILRSYIVARSEGYTPTARYYKPTQGVSPRGLGVPAPPRAHPGTGLRPKRAPYHQRLEELSQGGASSSTTYVELTLAHCNVTITYEYM